MSPNDFLDKLSASEQRYQQREPEREAFQTAKKDKNLLALDSAERIQKRFSRLSVDKEIQDALFAKPEAGERELAADLTAGLVSTAKGIVMEGPPDEKVYADPLLERVLGNNDLMNINYLMHGYQLSRAVGRVHIRDRRQRPRGFGTGFMVSPRLFMTNNHVLNSPDIAATSRVEFDYLIGLDGEPFPTAFYDFVPQEFFLTDKHLDFTLIAVNPAPDDGRELEEFGWIHLFADEGKAIKGEYMTIIQHPNGEPKQIAMRENELIDVLEDFLIYQTDTAPGSSGSPVFNYQWEVVALHHSGVPKRKDGKILTRDGQIWLPAMGEHRIDWLANEGVRISRILNFIDKAPLKESWKKLKIEMDLPQSIPTPTGGVSLTEKDEPRIQQKTTVQAPTLGASPQINEDGSVTWQIPVQVTVQVGDLPPVVVPSRQPAAETPGAGEEKPEPPPASDPDLDKVLKKLKDADKKVYYDADKDKNECEAYYTDISARLAPATRFDRLHKLLKSTHANQPRYKPRVELYPWIDLQPNLKLRSIYSNIEFDAEEIIREDFQVSQEIARQMQEMMSRESSLTAEQIGQELSFLEASSPYNCEHVVPQSWFDHREPMKGDLHHLFTCEWGCNSFRNKYAYFDFADFEEAIRDDCGKRITEDNRFEPGNGKGAVARATLYFLLRYPGEINDQTGEFDKDRLTMLLDWHNNNPVTEHERHRNQAIFAVQGNRNPLIDHPEWADQIDFSLGFN